MEANEFPPTILQKKHGRDNGKKQSNYEHQCHRDQPESSFLEIDAVIRQCRQDEADDHAYERKEKQQYADDQACHFHRVLLFAFQISPRFREQFPLAVDMR